MTLTEIRKRLLGRRIKSIDFRRFRRGDGRSSKWTTDPLLTLDDGSTVHFVVMETEVGEYGVEFSIHPK